MERITSYEAPDLILETPKTTGEKCERTAFSKGRRWSQEGAWLEEVELGGVGLEEVELGGVGLEEVELGGVGLEEVELGGWG